MYRREASSRPVALWIRWLQEFEGEAPPPFKLLCCNYSRYRRQVHGLPLLFLRIQG